MANDNLCSKEKFQVVEKVFAFSFIITAVLSLLNNKVLQKYGGFAGFLTILLYSIIINNPFLNSLNKSKNYSSENFLNSEHFVQFTQLFAVCGVFLLIIANALTKDKVDEYKIDDDSGREDQPANRQS